MLFNSLDFLVFFPLVTALYFILPHRIRWCVLLAASCVFYMYFVPVYILILAFMIGVDYVAGIAIERAGVRAGLSGTVVSGAGGFSAAGMAAALRRKKLFLGLSIAANIGILAFFKYWGLLTGALNGLLENLHSTGRLEPLRLLLPVGLSFHTFQAMSYTIEVYRGRQTAERHLGIYALYVMFYPQLVAGPIERPGQLLPQFRERHFLNVRDLGVGSRLMLWGFFKKLVIADRVSEVVNYVYDNVGHVSPWLVGVAVFFFSIQIYCDFSGYSDIAIGAARVMGFRLMTNFNRPYLARDLRDFWARWHISLSSWFRDYLYIPLGGNWRGAGRMYVNLLIVFLVSGLWHGAGLNFLVWGAVHGLLLCGWVWMAGRGWRLGIALPRVVSRVVSGLLSFTLVSLAWVLFRSSDLGQAEAVFRRLFGRGGDGIFDGMVSRTTLLLGIGFAAGMMVVEGNAERLAEWREKRWWVDVIFGAIVLIIILLWGVFTNQKFIYFQF